jgi:sugar/nucleoside kinase (ribokinase family)
VHLAPVAGEVEPGIVRSFPDSLICVSPQGWLRGWDADGRVFPAEWPESSFVLAHTDACVMSLEDVGADEGRIDELASSCRILAVTEGNNGSRLYWNGDVRRFPAPLMDEHDPTGAGDIFAAAFFVRLLATRDPWEAARFATLLSAVSVTRPGLEGVPTLEEIQSSLVEVF